jgi:ribulose-5-phosphate 4-epimerase/fuculose-1-phosphate aldolase
VLPYYAPGTEDLAEAVAGCDAARAMVLANHGVFAFADGFAGALGIVEEIEENCRAYLLAGGRGRTLTEAEVQALISRSM